MKSTYRLGLGAVLFFTAQQTACSSEFKSCYATRTCPRQAGNGGDEDGGEGGAGGARAGQVAGDGGSGGAAGSADASGGAVGVAGADGGEAGAIYGSRCGDGHVDGAEACDDGNVLAGDGCDTACSIELGWTCSGIPTTCKDVDECVLHTDSCNANASCSNTIGAFKCTCDVGFVGDGKNCAPSITVGQAHGCLVSTSGTVKCWGYNHYGQLGDGTNVNKGSAVAVVGLGANARQVVAGAEHTCALLDPGTVKCWGDDEHGSVGDGTTGDEKGNRPSPTSLPSLQNVREVAAGYSHTCVVLNDGTVKCWGDDSSGQLGDGTFGDDNGNRLSPVSVPTESLGQDVVQVVAGQEHTCALLGGGEVKCWGLNSSGQLGDGTTTLKLAPVGVVTLDHGVRQLAAGGDHTCALLSTGAVECWGGNQYGQLGNGGVSTSFTARETAPVPVATLSSGVIQIAVGDRNACALLGSGGVKCWGENAEGAVGDGTTGDSNGRRVMPVAAATLGQGVVQVALGFDIGCALLGTGSVKCWGGNDFGSTGTETPSFVAVLTPTSVIGVP